MESFLSLVFNLQATLCKFSSTANQLVHIFLSKRYKFWEVKLMFYPINSCFYSLVGVAYGTGENPKISFWKAVNLRAGVNKIALLSATVGLQVCICIHDQSTLFEEHS